MILYFCRLKRTLEIRVKDFVHLNQCIILSVEKALGKSSERLESLQKEIAFFNQTREPGIMEKIKENVNLNQEENRAVDLVVRALQDMGKFYNKNTKEINEISMKYLDKYREFAKENAVAMRLTEAVLYSLCSSESGSFFVPENYFHKYFNEDYSPGIKLGAIVANSFVEFRWREEYSEDNVLFLLDTWKGFIGEETLVKSAGTILGFNPKDIENCLYNELRVSFIFNSLK